jgi:hypothetical protein
MVGMLTLNHISGVMVHLEISGVMVGMPHQWCNGWCAHLEISGVMVGVLTLRSVV